MKNILEAPFIKEMKETTVNMYRLGWDERNGGNISYLLSPDEVFALVETVEKAAQIYMLTARLTRVNTIKAEEMMELAEYFGVNYRKDFLNL